MMCPTCKELPETVIWDGVTLAFNKKNLQESLHPPTTIETNSIVRNGSYPRNQPLITNSDCRKLLLATFSESLRHPQHVTINNLNDDDISSEDNDQIHSKEFRKQSAKIDGLPRLQELLKNESPYLEALFVRYCSLSALSKFGECPQNIAKFFFQVSIVICKFPFTHDFLVAG